MLYNYTAVITESDGTFYASVPDIDGCITTAKSLSEAITLITDALNLCLIVVLGLLVEYFHPLEQSNIPHEKPDILTIIQADTIKYRSMTDTKSVCKNGNLRGIKDAAPGWYRITEEGVIPWTEQPRNI